LNDWLSQNLVPKEEKKMGGFPWDMSLHEPNKATVNESNLLAFPPIRAALSGLQGNFTSLDV